MPNKTGIKNRLDYINRIIAEDKKLKDKDAEYGAYLEALTNLVLKTNEVYKNGGNFTKESYENLVKAYLDVTEKANAYKVSTLDSESITRMNVVNHIQKIISRDMKVLNNIDKENPGKIEDAFEASRAIKVNVPESMTNKVGGQMSERFPMVAPDGRKGFFTARTDTAQEKKWEAVFAKIENLGLAEGHMERINELKTDHGLRKKLMNAIHNPYVKTMGELYSNVAVALGFFSSGIYADSAWKNKENKKLLSAMRIIAADGRKLTAPYNMVDRLGYDPYTRNDNKNAAMYEIAKFLRCEKLIAKAEPMVVVNGNEVIKGTFMEHADGSDLANLKADDPMWKYDRRTSAYNKDLYRDLADLQIIDYICGNVDRHKGNMCYKTAFDTEGKLKITGVVGIDNDASFPEENIQKSEFLPAKYGGKFEHPRIFKPKYFRFVNKQTAEIIRNMTRAQLETILRGKNISSKAIDLAWNRAQEVKDVLNEMQKNNISFTEDIKEGTLKTLTNKENPFQFVDDDAAGVKLSMFTEFDKDIRDDLFEVVEMETAAQLRRKGEAENKKAKLDMEEYEQFKKSQEENAKVAQAKDVTVEQAIFADKNKIANMNAVMDRINRLKYATKEFAAMRGAMFSLYEYHRELSNKIKDGNTLTKKQVEEYGNRIKNLKDATNNYIMEKGLTPRTEKGRERLDGAMKIDHGVDMLLESFEAFKDKGEMQADKQEIDQDMGME